MNPLSKSQSSMSPSMACSRSHDTRLSTAHRGYFILSAHEGPMGRLLQLLLLAALVYVAWRLVRRALTPPAAAEPQYAPTARCARCGTHVPREQLDAAGACARCRANPGTS